MWFSENILSSRFMHKVLVKKNCWGSQAGSQLPAFASAPGGDRGGIRVSSSEPQTHFRALLFVMLSLFALFTWLFPGTWGDVLLPVQFMFKQSPRFKCSWRLMCS